MRRSIVLRPILLASLLVIGPTATIAKVPPQQSKVADNQQTQSAVPATTGADENPACRKVRRRLWIENEGWFIRSVRICN
jgi:hypothetical protein